MYRRILWLIIPLSVLVGDVAIRWGSEVFDLLSRKNALNFPASVLISFGFWWAVSAFVGRSERRWVWGTIVGSLAALLVASAWQYRLVMHHDPNPGLLLYFFHEPTNAAQLASTGMSWMWGIATVALAGVWSAALALTEQELTKRLRIAAWFVIIGFFLAAFGWHDPKPQIEAPYVSDVNVGVLFGRAFKRGIRFGMKDVLNEGRRKPVELTEADAERDRPNVLLFLGESLRRTRMGVYGCERDTTPRLQGFFDEHGDGIVDFPHAEAASAFTPLAVTAILTGLYPARDHARIHEAPVIWQYARALGGWSAVGSPQLWSWSNLSLFYLLNEGPDYARTADEIEAEIVNDTGIHDMIAAREFVDVLKSHEGDGDPFFGLFQANSTHYPLLPDDDTPWEIESRPDRYDSAVRVTDEAFGAIVDALKETGRLDDTIIIFTSDHGEFDWDKISVDDPDRQIAHDILEGERIESCHPVVTRVPFFVYVPPKWRGRLGPKMQSLRENDERLVSTIDAFPTILDAWDVDPVEPVDGRSLFEPLPENRTVFCFTAPPWGRWLLTGMALLDTERALYYREDFDHPQAFDLGDRRLYEEQFSGTPPTDADRRWLEETSAEHPLVRRYRKLLGETSQP